MQGNQKQSKPVQANPSLCFTCCIWPAWSMGFVLDSLFHMFRLTHLLDVLCGSSGILCFTCFVWPVCSMSSVVIPGVAHLLDVLCGSFGMLCFTCFVWPACSMFYVFRPGFFVSHVSSGPLGRCSMWFVRDSLPLCVSIA